LGINIRSKHEIEALRRANQVVVQVLNDLKECAKPGTTTMELERTAIKRLKKIKRAKPAFLGYRGYPAVLCASINEEVVHGIPSDKRRLKQGDIISVDFGVEMDGYFGDAAVTVPVGKIDQEKKRLLQVTQDCLEKAFSVMAPGNRLSDIAAAIQGHAEKNGFSVVYQFVGHGIGRKMHEEPQVPNCGAPKPDVKLVEGMVLAIEPMINAGVPEVEVLDDGWTAVTADRRPSAHFERSVAIAKDGVDILSLW
jgi:methionyl aminopeptidase